MGKVPEALNVTHGEAVIDIHRQYIEAGADIIYANTFSANRYKLSYSDYSVEELVTAGVKNAKKRLPIPGEMWLWLWMWDLSGN